jgi:hypothetical protein
MKQRNKEEQITGILRTHEKGVTVLEICRKQGLQTDLLPQEEQVRRHGSQRRQ